MSVQCIDQSTAPMTVRTQSYGLEFNIDSDEDIRQVLGYFEYKLTTDETRRCDLYEGDNVIGRCSRKGSTILIDDMTVSAIHARITAINQRTFLIADLKSTNGTIVNEVLLSEPYRPYDLHDGAMIALGRVKGQFLMAERCPAWMESLKEENFEDYFESVDVSSDASLFADIAALPAISHVQDSNCDGENNNNDDNNSNNNENDSSNKISDINNGNDNISEEANNKSSSPRLLAKRNVVDRFESGGLCRLLLEEALRPRADILFHPESSTNQGDAYDLPSSPNSALIIDLNDTIIHESDDVETTKQNENIINKKTSRINDNNNNRKKEKTGQKRREKIKRNNGGCNANVLVTSVFEKNTDHNNNADGGVTNETSNYESINEQASNDVRVNNNSSNSNGDNIIMDRNVDNSDNDDSHIHEERKKADKITDNDKNNRDPNNNDISNRCNIGSAINNGSDIMINCDNIINGHSNNGVTIHTKTGNGSIHDTDDNRINNSNGIDSIKCDEKNPAPKRPLVKANIEAKQLSELCDRQERTPRSRKVKTGSSARRNQRRSNKIPKKESDTTPRTSKNHRKLLTATRSAEKSNKRKNAKRKLKWFEDCDFRIKASQIGNVGSNRFRRRSSRLSEKSCKEVINYKEQSESSGEE